MKKFPPIESVTTAEEAYDLAVSWQLAFDGAELDMLDLSHAQDYFENLADKFPELKDEFKENAII